jgi:cobalt/nickel transport system permease protein
MHIPDGFLDPKIAGGLVGIAVMVLGYCLSKVKQAVTAVVPEAALAAAGKGLRSISIGSKRVLTKFGENLLLKMGAVASLVFAAQMFNFPIDGGTSGHLIGGVLAVVILGPFAGSLVIAAVLTVQSFFFADGGIVAIGANIVNMSIIGALISYYIYIALKKILPETASIMLTAWFSVIMAALACSLEIGFSGSVALNTIIPAMVKTHAIIGMAEAFITIALLNLFWQMVPSEDENR